MSPPKSNTPQTVAELLLELDRQHPGAADAPMQLDARTWAQLVAAARREAR